MALRATRPAVSGSSRSATSVRVSRATYGTLLRSRRIKAVLKAAGDSEAAEAPAGSALIGKFFAGLSRIGTTGTVQLRIKKEEPKESNSKDERDDGVVFVAGATGRTGARVVRELLESGFTVRAGARNVESAQSALTVAATYGIVKPEQLKRVTVVPFDLGNPGGFEEAIGRANKIVCAVGAAEDQPLNFSAPKKIDGEGTAALVNKAAELGVSQFVLVSSLGTGKLGWPAGVLNLFGGVLLWKREAEKALESSGMAYTIVRPGGMERPTDDYKRTHNLVLKPRDTTFGGQVSRLQVAELVAAACSTPTAAENKVLEVVAETTALPRGLEELMSEIGQDVAREAQLANKEVVDAARSNLAAAQLKSSEAAAALLVAEKRVQELAARLKEAKVTEAAVSKEVAPLLKQAKPLEAQLAEARNQAELAVLLETASKVTLERARKAAGAGVLLSEKERAAITEEVLNPPKPEATEVAAPQPGGMVFGFFGKKPKAPPVEPVPEPVPEPTPVEEPPAVKVFGFFGKKPEAPPAEPVPEPVPEPAPVVEPPVIKPTPVGLFAGLFGKPVAVDQPAMEPAPVAAVAEVAIQEEPAVPIPVARQVRATPPPPVPEAEPEVVVMKSTAPEVVVEEPKPLFNVGSFFGGFMKRMEEQQTVQVEEQEEAVAEPQPVPAVAAAVAPEATVEVPVATPAPKPATPSTADVSPEEERRRKAVEAAKAALAASFTAQSAPAPMAPTASEVPEPEPVKAEKPQEAVAVDQPPAEPPKTATEEESPESADIARRKAEVKAWIAAWKDGRNASAVPQSGDEGAAEVDSEKPEPVDAQVSNFFTGLLKGANLSVR